MTPATYHVFCLSEAAGPITHMARSEGNEQLVAREPVVTARGVLWVPFLSGNALRHRCVRAPGARWLVERLGLRGQLTLPQLNFLLHGGNLTEGGGREDTRRIADLQELFPLLRLLGGTLPDQIVSGSLLCGRGLLVCDENRAALAGMLPRGWEMPAHALRPAETFVSGYQYTRQDAARSAPDLLSPPAEGVVGPEEDAPVERGGNRDGKSNQMIFSGQAVTRGSLFAHQFICQHVSRLEVGALLLSLALWLQEGGTVGGQGARGHGRLLTRVHLEIDGDPLSEYVAHVEANRYACAAWLNAAFAARVPRPAAPPKGPKAKARA